MAFIADGIRACVSHRKDVMTYGKVKLRFLAAADTIADAHAAGSAAYLIWSAVAVLMAVSVRISPAS